MNEPEQDQKPLRSIKLRLILDIDYELHGVHENEIISIFQDIPKRLDNEGFMTGETAVEVAEWTSEVEVLDTEL